MRTGMSGGTAIASMVIGVGWAAMARAWWWQILLIASVLAAGCLLGRISDQLAELADALRADRGSNGGKASGMRESP